MCNSIVGKSQKWLKYCMLVSWKLREEKELLGTLHCYPFSEYKSCLRDIRKDMAYSEKTYTYIVKFVYPYLSYKLPNYIIENTTDLIQCRKKILNLLDSGFSEIWYCKNVNDDCNIWGRIRIDLNELFPRLVSQRIEMVWGKTARIIEHFPNIDGTFFFLEKTGWDLSYTIKEFYCKGKTKSKAYSDINRLLFQLQKYRFDIMEFCGFLKSCNCKCVTLEFLFKENKLFILDWDSDNDENAVKKYKGR